MRKDSKKLGELLKQLEDAGYDVKDAKGDSNIENLKQSSNISRETLDKISNETSANFAAWVSWSKSF
ncbi:hypothetical protein [Arenibacter sp. S6351L]|uniref:hypothetical protein n=1 Tax=Arenibacter sp. S6351L TaxID=2926407 RepID=UPI001FF180CE|nr:hypothetical protein [Arenibacter sp. S6351L]MCK0133673.1 hypothetical protein [Arenibacter sp. S6351L]